MSRVEGGGGGDHGSIFDGFVRGGQKALARTKLVARFVGRFFNSYSSTEAGGV